MVVISLGGSRIIPRDIDIDFLLSFREAILKQSESETIHIVCGGGYLARQYQKAMRDIFSIGIKKSINTSNLHSLALKNHSNSNVDLDLIGIESTRINALLVSFLFKGIKNVKVYSGTVPGHSTDFVATEIAVKYKTKDVINFSNISFVYDKDPKLHKNAKRIKNMSFDDFEKQFGKTWIPGNNIPFDPKAISLAKRKNLRILFCDSIADMIEIFSGKVSGTIIEK